MVTCTEFVEWVRRNLAEVLRMLNFYCNNENNIKGNYQYYHYNYYYHYYYCYYYYNYYYYYHYHYHYYY